jgi:hypothetical protein
MAPTERIACFNSRFWLDLVYTDRLMEATLLSPDQRFEAIRPEIFRSIGIHARDVLGRKASPCETVEWVLDWLKLVWAEVIIDIDPWLPLPPRPPRPPLPWFDLQPFVDVALGGALVAVRQAMPYPALEIDEKDFGKSVGIAAEGGRRALEMALKEAVADHRGLGKRLNGGVRAVAETERAK